MKDTPRSRKLYTADDKKQIQQYGGDELTPEPNGRNARQRPQDQKRNRNQLGVDAEHKTPEMEKGHRGTFP